MSAKILIIVPPFHSVERPSIGAHIVQAQCLLRGLKVDVLYLNLNFAAIIGFPAYKMLCDSQTNLFLGESIFSHETLRLESFKYVASKTGLTVEKLIESVDLIQAEVKSLALKKTYRIIGSSTMFQQNNASLLFLQIFKKADPNVITVLGGGGCSELQAYGLLNLSEKYYSNAVDKIFSGECENAFAEFAEKTLQPDKSAYSEKIIRPKEKVEMENIPFVDYKSFFDQAAICKEKITPATIWLPLETSRGCWWGMKSHCTFCALSKDGIIYRTKSSKKVYEEICSISGQNYSKKIIFIDSIMPQTTTIELMSKLKQKGLYFYMEQKVPLKYYDAKIMSEAGVIAIQPGIESMSAQLLKKMKKGTHPYQNIELLRFCCMLDINVEWNFLHGIPGETDLPYKEMISFLSCLEHLNAPSSLSEISLEKFSPYHNYPEEFGITNIKEVENYKYCYPKDSDICEVYTCFEGTYPRLSHDNPSLFLELETEVNNWIESWKNRRSELSLTKISEGIFLIKDTRKVAVKKWHQLPLSNAIAALFPQCDSVEDKEWALKNKLAIIVGGIYVPLVTCKTDLYEELIRFSNSIQK